MKGPQRSASALGAQAAHVLGWPIPAPGSPARQELGAKVAKHRGDGHSWRVVEGTLRCSCGSALLTRADRP
jgi:hypothetical protein